MKYILLLCLIFTTYSQQIKLEDINSEQTFALIKSFQNKQAVLVNFWATWCAPCVEEFPSIVKLQKENQTKLKVLFISFDLNLKKNDVLAFLKKNEVDWVTYFKTESDDLFIQNMPKLWDGALPFTMIFRLDGTPEIYLTGKQEFNTFAMHVKNAIRNGVIR